MRAARAWHAGMAWVGRLVAAFAEAGRHLIYRRQELAVLCLFFGSLLVGLGVVGLERRAPALLERLEAEPERPLSRPRAARPGGGSRPPVARTEPATVKDPAATTPRPPPGAPLLDLNTAQAADLERLPGIGPRLARRIVEERERAGPFRAPRELHRVRGLGPRMVEALEPLVTAGTSGEPR